MQRCKPACSRSSDSVSDMKEKLGAEEKKKGKMERKEERKPVHILLGFKILVYWIPRVWIILAVLDSTEKCYMDGGISLIGSVSAGR